MKLETRNNRYKTRLKDSGAQYRRLFEAAQDGIFILEGKTGRIIEANQFIIDMLGYAKKDLVGKRLWELVAFGDIAKSKKAYRELQSRKYVRYENIPLESKDGKKMEVEFVSNVYLVGRMKVIQCNIRDISYRKQHERKMSHMAMHDGLTGLPNRTLTYDRFENAAANADRKSTKVAIMSIDLDNFKDINDVHGHDIGDMLLKKIAERMTGILRKSDTIGRFGGDEFVLLLTDIVEIKHAALIAQKILNVFKRPFILNGSKIRITPSIGIVIYPDDGADINDLIKKSDKTMYRAKEDGRNNYKLHERKANP